MKEEEKEILIFLKGYLSAISVLNSFTNNHLIADVVYLEIDAKSSIEEILVEICKTDKFVFTIKELGKLGPEIKKILPKYTERFIMKIAETRTYPFNNLDTKKREELINEIKAPIEDVDFSYTICHLLDKLITQDDKKYRVEVNDSKGPLYSLVDDTFLVKGEKRAIFIKFGLVD